MRATRDLFPVHSIQSTKEDSEAAYLVARRTSCVDRMLHGILHCEWYKDSQRTFVGVAAVTFAAVPSACTRALLHHPREGAAFIDHKDSQLVAINLVEDCWQKGR